MIDVSNMSAWYPSSKQNVLHDISFSVGEAEVFGFLGPSGAGKSTLQKVLTGVLKSYTGSVKVLGCEMSVSSQRFYEDIGVDFEFPNFYNKFTAFENLRFFSSLYAKDSLDAKALMARVGLIDDINKKVSGYSKGMKSRLGFVRSLLHDPKLLFLDEPLSGLDPSNSRIIKDMIQEQKEAGKTIILTTHNMHDAVELCDRVAFIVDGRIKALGSPKELQSGKAETRVTFCYAAENRLVERDVPLSALYADNEFMQALSSGSLKNIHSKEKTLEDVFIELTGRSLQ